MANPNPSPENRFKPGNKAAKGRATPYAVKLRKFINKHKHDEDVITAWLGAAMGDEKLLKGRKPNFQFFKELLDRLDGKIPDEVKQEITQQQPTPVDYEHLRNPRDQELPSPAETEGIRPDEG